jgi:hypothetical protein
MSTITITIPRPRLRRTPIVGIACAAAGALATLALTHGSTPRAAVYTAPAQAFRVALPHGWRATPHAALDALPGRPLAVLRSADGRAAVVIGPAASAADPSGRQLARELARRFHPFKPLAARTVATRAGAAHLYAFARGAVVESVAVASLRGRSYTIDGVVASGANADAQQLGAIVASFGP